MSESTIVPRNVRFDLSETPVHWVPGDPFTTHFINPLHLLLPAGERWFVRIYKQVLPEITDPVLRADVQAFVRQEAIHARVHDEVLDHFAARGMNLEPYTDRIEAFFKKILGDDPLPLPAWAPSVAPIRRQWLVTRLGLIAAVEHFTCILGRWVLEQRGLDEAGTDPVMLDLLRWHGAEEVEHRTVAHRAYVHAGGTYLGRQAHMVIVFPAFLSLWIAGFRFLVGADRTIEGRKPSVRQWGRAARQNRLPSLRHLTEATLRYAKTGYDPETEAPTALALDYLSSSPAARAYGAA